MGQSVIRSLSFAARESRNVVEVLSSRVLLGHTSNREKIVDAARNPMKVYCGFDPTADSLHLGNYLGLVALKWFQLCGHEVFCLIGGSTARIGDPSGKSGERPIMSPKVIERNSVRIEESIKRILGPCVKVVNNLDWIGSLSFLDFLDTIGRKSRVGSMLNRESVRSRLESPTGLSFAEFSYQLLQAYDYAHLYENYGVTLQIGGSDQLGNMQAGVDLAKKFRPDGETLHTLTFPLLTTADGKKYGKTEKGAVWLEADRLSPYSFYQYLVQAQDADVINLLRKLTMLPEESILEAEEELLEAPLSAQRLLAETLTRDLHGEDGLASALKATDLLKPGSIVDRSQLSSELLLSLTGDLPVVTVNRKKLREISLKSVLLMLKLGKRSGLEQLLKDGHGYINNQRLEAGDRRISEDDLLDGQVMLVGAGKKKKGLVRVKDEPGAR
uniref:Tyrosine--tRNA ligase n=1 Tax=Rhodosorus marinus TaxID=101924 RepID=A0A7S2ZLT3_9RHOD|mmetsp:Transcript_24219/g.95360  ORF Transcript_24219/g.95360 Transcript_24219/m.95360 type:complete len:442 (+) Transcript_24219:477-1802(+)